MARVHSFVSSSNAFRRKQQQRRSNSPQDTEFQNLTQISQAPSPLKREITEEGPAVDVTAAPSPSTSAASAYISSSSSFHAPATNAESSSSPAVSSLPNIPAITAALLHAQQQNQSSGGDIDLISAVASAMNVKPETIQSQFCQNADSATAGGEVDEKGKRPETANNDLMEPALQLLGLAQSSDIFHKYPTSDPQQDGSVTLSRHAQKNRSSSETTGSQNVEEESADNYKRGPWTPEEDELLVAGIKRFGYGKWKEIATIIPGRRGKQLKQRWDNTLAAKYVDTNWLKSKIRGDDEPIPPPKPAPPIKTELDDKLLKIFDAADWADMAQKITERARETNTGEAIEALLSHSLLGAMNNTATGTTATASTSASSSSTELAVLPSTSTQSSPPPNSVSTTPVNFADAALVFYLQQILQHQQNSADASTANSNSNASETSANTNVNPSVPFLYPNALTNLSANEQAVALAAAAAVAAMATVGNPQVAPNTDRRVTNSGRHPYAPRKRRRSNPALAETQSAAMSIYASSAPITTTINNQTQTVYPCLFPNCGKTFARLYNLKSHSRTHTDDRPFVCDFCQAAFSRNHDLKRHSKVHEQRKPYKCLGCNKDFSRLDALKRHKNNKRNKPACMSS